MNFSLKKKFAAVAAAATIASGAGIAFAYWTSEGTGVGAATAGDAAAWLVTTTAATGGPLSPGGPLQTVGFKVTNQGAGFQRLNQVVISVAGADNAGNKVAWASGNCDADDFQLDAAAAAADVAAGAALTVPVAVDLGKDQYHSGSVTVQMINKSTTSQDDCKNVTVPLYLSAS